MGLWVILLLCGVHSCVNEERHLVSKPTTVVYYQKADVLGESDVKKTEGDAKKSRNSARKSKGGVNSSGDSPAKENREKPQSRKAGKSEGSAPSAGTKEESANPSDCVDCFECDECESSDEEFSEATEKEALPQKETTSGVGESIEQGNVQENESDSAFEMSDYAISLFCQIVACVIAVMFFGYLSARSMNVVFLDYSEFE